MEQKIQKYSQKTLDDLLLFESKFTLKTLCENYKEFGEKFCEILDEYVIEALKNFISEQDVPEDYCVRSTVTRIQIVNKKTGFVFSVKKSFTVGKQLTKGKFRMTFFHNAFGIETRIDINYTENMILSMIQDVVNTIEMHFSPINKYVIERKRDEEWLMGLKKNVQQI